MINPAMHPGELWYPVNSSRTAPVSTLKLIPRKAIVYSKYDYPNGLLFNLREALLDVQGGQKHQVFLDDFNDRTFSDLRDKPILRAIGTPVTSLLNGPVALAYSIIHGSLLYVSTTIINLPFDFWHHIQHNHADSAWIPEWIKWDPPGNRHSAGSIAGRAANFLDFFVPLLPFGPSRDEQLQGIFRLSRPALGKTGIAKLADGRAELPNLYGLKSFYSSHYAPDVKSDDFCRYLKREIVSTSLPDHHVNLNRMRDAIFSFDASNVYDDWGLPVGAHDDVRDRDDSTSCPSSTLSPPQLDHANSALRESTTRLKALFETCPTDGSIVAKCEDKLAALDSLEIMNRPDPDTFTVSISMEPFQKSKRTYGAAHKLLEEFWMEIETPLKNELATRIGSLSSRGTPNMSIKLQRHIKREKREQSFHFVHLFTKGYLDNDLDKIFPTQ